MNESDFAATMRKIVTTCLPDEIVAFDLAGEEHIERAFRSSLTVEAGSPGAGKRSGAKKELAEFEFLEEAKKVIEFAGLIKGTLELHKWFKKEFKEAKHSHDSAASLTVRWTEELRKAGLSEKKAELIALKCSADVLELLRKGHEHN